MTKTLFLLPLLLLCFACNSDDDVIMPPNPVTDCTTLCEAVAISETAIIRDEIAALTADLAPVITNDDPIGQKANLDTLVTRLDNCSCFEASLVCYACIETFPPLSEIKVVLTHNGETQTKVFDIRTSETETLSFSGLHE